MLTQFLLKPIIDLIMLLFQRVLICCKAVFISLLQVSVENANLDLKIYDGKDFFWVINVNLEAYEHLLHLMTWSWSSWTFVSIWCSRISIWILKSLNGVVLYGVCLTVTLKTVAWSPKLSTITALSRTNTSEISHAI